jgi:EmrB/QacA subfamily drug resistance transporter
MTTTSQPARRAPGEARRGIHPGVALAVIAGAQLMVVLDATIVNIALPHIQSALNFSTTGLSWVLNAYTLTFGGLLLLGGRAGDILGRRRVFIFGIVLFAFASLLGGLATSSGWLLGARALQGVGGAIASPTALALITTNFPEGPQRNRAFGVYAAVSGSGAALGLLLGGMLTEWLSWRWVLFVNVPIGAVIALLAPLYIFESERHPGRFDVAGALTSTAGMVALVYGFIRAAQSGWSDTVTIASFVAAVVLLTVFLTIETRTRQPITPLHMFRNRNRAGTYVIMLCVAAGLFGMFFFLTLFVQEVLGYSPLKAGLAFLPVSAVIIVAAQVVARGIPTIGPKRFMIAGSVLSVAGLGWLSRLTVSSGYTDGLLGPMLLFGLGLGFLFVPLTLTAVSHVRREESGAASSLLNAMQQVGSSLGLSILVTVFGTASRNEATAQIRRFLSTASPQLRAQFLRTGQLPRQVTSEVLAYGISRAFLFAALFALIALVVSIVVIQGPPREPAQQPEAGAAPAGADSGGS